jgi:mono/diheme cytochrome c family protein
LSPLKSTRGARVRAVAAAVAALALTSTATACGGRASTPDLVNGKALFVQRCGSCHVLERAGTAGKTGPNLDQAFGPARRDGLGSRTIAGVVRDQILYPGRNSPMPAKIVTGKDARDVGAYVGKAAGVPGQDVGALATAGLAGATDGKQIFTAAGCGGCHTLSAAGANGTIGPNLNGLGKDVPKPGMPPQKYIEESILKPNAFVTPGYRPGVMPQNYARQLTPQQVKALSDFIAKS